MSTIKDLPLYPFFYQRHEQKRAKEENLEKVRRALKSDETGQVILVSGESETGKTVLEILKKVNKSVLLLCVQVGII